MSASPRWVSRQLALAIHARTVFLHGGQPGVRDDGLLESALAAPQQRHAYEGADTPTLAASYAYALSRNHAFLDGNKRTALIVAGVFLELNGWRLECEEAEAAHVSLALAAGRLPEEDLVLWFKAAASKTRPASRRRKAPATKRRRDRPTS